MDILELINLPEVVQLSEFVSMNTLLSCSLDNLLVRNFYVRVLEGA